MIRQISAASLAIPDLLVKSYWQEHAPFAFWLVEAHRPRLTVELGTYSGYSLAVLAQAHDIAGIDGKLVGIDTWEGDDHSGFFGEKSQSMHSKLSQYMERVHPGRVTLMRMHFSEALEQIPDGSVDLLHIDGRHGYHDVKSDHTSWIPKLSSRAIILFHDTQVTKPGFGVTQYWNEVSAGKSAFEFEHCNGLGVLAHGNIDSPALGHLLDPELPPAEGELVRDVYARLGQAITQIRMLGKPKRSLLSRWLGRNRADSLPFFSR